jgi:hypothetical protein
VFRDTLNEVLRKDAHVVDPTLEALATRQSEGWLHIIGKCTHTQCIYSISSMYVYA